MFKFQHVLEMHPDETSVLAFSFLFNSVGMQQAGTKFTVPVSGAESSPIDKNT